mgnify:FL=1
MEYEGKAIENIPIEKVEKTQDDIKNEMEEWLKED